VSRAAALLCIVLSACGDAPGEEPAWDEGGADTPEYSLGSVLVAAADRAELQLYDLDDDTMVGRLPFEPSARVYTGPSGRYGYALDAAGLHALEPHEWLLSHIDHFHVAPSTFALRAETLPVKAPIWFAGHDGWVTVRDAASTTWFQERTLTARSFAPTTLATRGAGVALVSHAQLLSDDGSRVLQRSALDPTQELASFACGTPTSMRVVQDRVEVSCAEGLLALRWEGARFASSWRPAAIPPDVVDYAVHRSGRAYALTRDGRLHDLHAGRSLPVLAPDVGRARLVLSHAYAYVADPRTRELPAIRLRTLAIEKRVVLEAAPHDITLLGVPPGYTDERE
jgi:hypothetical protein